MFDELLGRAELKDRIEALEDELESLEAQLEAEQERRTDAVSARQEAEEELNRLEDRIAELEDRAQRAEAASGAGPEFRGQTDLRGESLRTVLDRLESVTAPPEGALTAMVGADAEIPASVANILGDRAALVGRAAPCLVCLDDSELVSVALRPPVAPERFEEWGSSFAIDRSWFLPEDVGRHALAVVRSDLFAFGVFEGRDRVEFQGFTSDVKGDHSKGGFSQARFERRRDEQIAAHLDRVAEALADAPDPLYVVGESTVLGEVAEAATVTAPSDATGSPEDALAEARADFWSAKRWLL